MPVDRPVGGIPARGQLRGREGVEQVVVVGRQAPEADQRLDRGRVEPLERRQELRADPVASVGEVRVRGVGRDSAIPAASSAARSTARRAWRSGRTIRPRRAGMPRSPRRPLPRARRSRIVSAASSAVCAVAISASGPRPRGHLLEEAVAGLAAGVLERSVLGRRQRGDVDAAHLRRQPQAARPQAATAAASSAELGRSA